MTIIINTIIGQIKKNPLSKRKPTSVLVPLLSGLVACSQLSIKPDDKVILLSLQWCIAHLITSVKRCSSPSSSLQRSIAHLITW